MKSHIKILVIIDLIKSISYFINFYYSLENYIQSTIQRIPLKKGAENLCGNEDISMNQNISKEYQFFENCIDYDEEHYNHLHPGDMRKDRYSDIKSYSHNIVTINDGQNYINASPINIICDKYFIISSVISILYRLKVQKKKQLMIFGQWYSSMNAI